MRSVINTSTSVA